MMIYCQAAASVTPQINSWSCLFQPQLSIEIHSIDCGMTLLVQLKGHTFTRDLFLLAGLSAWVVILIGAF